MLKAWREKLQVACEGKPIKIAVEESWEWERWPSLGKYTPVDYLVPVSPENIHPDSIEPTDQDTFRDV